MFHATLIIFRGYFLSIEFTLYPYLTSHGFLPYQNIIDQHFPTLMFGPFSLPVFLTSNPWPILGLFLTVLCLTDVLLYASLIRFEVKKPFVWLVLYIVSSSYFSGNVLWIETFVNLLLATWIFLSFSIRPGTRFVSGLILSQIFLLRPTIIPAVAILFFGLSYSVSLPLVLGLISGIGVPLIFLFHQDILQDFYRLAIVFNGSVYPHGAQLLPAKRQILTLFLFIAPVFCALIKRKKYIFLLSLTFIFILIFPRFGYEHLQPLYLCAVLFWALNQSRPDKVVYLFILIFLALNIVSSIRHPYGNYFLTPEVKSIAQTVKDLPGSTVYLLGASDLIYPLSGKIPPKYTYLPSLPWYFGQQEFVDRVIVSLSDKNTPVLVDYSSAVDGYNVLESSGLLFEYIKMNFIPGEKIGNYRIFFPNP